MRALVVIASAGLLISCGVVGTPVAPEFVGVAPTIDKQKRQHALEAERQATESVEPDPTLGGHEMDLPPSQPVGIR
ncbi:hypothetical protein [Candidatus Nitrospira nitrificans]|uniref:Secreted protein n=1 Tax=Candidatus Nitrospira nitrificans TaxID=1742973 RepID=A0A0S4LF62_9BACT|nr:hypothetical protein [Candidatus Nitrospira nitrificans]CUS35513.1 exported hypothetical protein [Candidatus Nitrospira nitrificans]